MSLEKTMEILGVTFVALFVFGLAFTLGLGVTMSFLEAIKWCS